MRESHLVNMSSCIKEYFPFLTNKWTLKRRDYTQGLSVGIQQYGG